MRNKLMAATAAAWRVKRGLSCGTQMLVDIRTLRMGQVAGLPMATWARATGDDSMVATTMENSPHVHLLLESKRGLAVNRSHYVMRWADRIREVTGHFHGATTREEIAEAARGFVRDWASGVRRDHAGPITVANIDGSRAFEVVDGHHRIAKMIACLPGGTPQPAVRPVLCVGTVPSWWRWKLGRVHMTKKRELYQPLDLPETADWPLVRRCQDRLDMITGYLDESGLNIRTALDLGCSYGFFAAGLARWGVSSILAVDRDRHALDVGRLLYGLHPDLQRCQRAEDYLGDPLAPRADAVLFLSLLHHYAIGREPGDVRTVIAGLASKTKKVLFLDSGEAREAWFHRKLPGWTPNHIRDLVMEYGGFREAVALGVDADARRPYADNYGRTLWAFTK